MPKPITLPLEKLIEALLRQAVIAPSPEAAAQIAALAQTYEVPRDGFLFRKGDPAAIHFILSGAVSVIAADSVVATLHEGEVLGEFALLYLQETHQATARAEQDTIVAKLPAAEFAGIANALPALWRAIAKSLAVRLQRRNERTDVDVMTTFAANRARSAERAERHRAQAERYGRLNTLIGLPSAIIAAVVGSSVLGSLASDPPDQIFVILAGVLSLSAAVLSSLQTFYGAAEKAQAHKAAADGYDALAREVDVILAKAQTLRSRGAPGEAEAALIEGSERVASSLAALDKASPSLPAGPKG